MGFRLSIKVMDEKTMVEKEFGDDHKLYGYWRYDAVKGSFSVIFPLIKEQWNTGDSTPEQVYDDYFIHGGMTDDLVVNNGVFREFIKEYISDLITTNHDPELVGNVVIYLTKLCNKHLGNKILYWS